MPMNALLITWSDILVHYDRNHAARIVETLTAVTNEAARILTPCEATWNDCTAHLDKALHKLAIVPAGLRYTH